MRFSKNHTIFIRVFFFVLFLSFATLFFGAPSIPSPTSHKYVNDYVGVVNTQETQILVSLGKELESLTGAQAVVAIVPTTEGIPIETYGLTLFRTWGIGQQSTDNGLLVLLSINDRAWRVEVGRGLEGAIPDSLSNRIMEVYAKQNFSEENYSKGLVDAYSVFCDMIATEYDVTLTHSLHLPPISTSRSSSSASSLPLIIIVGIVLADMLLNRGRLFSALLQIAFWSNLGGPRGPRGGSGGYGGGGHGGFGGGSSNGGGSSGSW